MSVLNSSRTFYRCRRSPWRGCLVWVCSQSEEWLPPSLGSARSAAWRSKWSCTSAINRQRRLNSHGLPRRCYLWLTDTSCREEQHLGGVGRSGSDSPQQLAAWNHLHSVCSWRRNVLLICTAALLSEGWERRSQTTFDILINLYKSVILFITKILYTNSCLLGDSYRFAGFLVFWWFLVVFLVSFKGCRANDMETLCPLPIERTQLLFAVKHKHIFSGSNTRDDFWQDPASTKKKPLCRDGSAFYSFQCFLSQRSRFYWETTCLCVVSLPNVSCML